MARLYTTSRAPRHGQQRPITWPVRGHDMTGLRVGASSARARVLAAVCHDIKFCIVTGGGNTALRHCISAYNTAPCGQHCTLRATQPATRPVRAATRLAVRAAWAFYAAIQLLYRDKGAATQRYSARVRATTLQGAPTTRPEGGHDTAPSTPRHSAQCATTRHPVRHDTTLCA